MQFNVLGPIEVEHPGRSVQLSGRRQLGLLAILLLNANEVVSTDRLVDDLWSDDPPANATAALHNHVSRLRKELGPESLLTRACGYVLRVDPEAVDACRFERLLDRAERLARAGIAGASAAALDEALDLWRGRPFEELGYERFLQGEVARLEERRLVAREARLDAVLALGGHAAAVPELEALIHEHPLRERLRAQLMLALYRSGRQADALAAYHAARRTLDDELGIAPGPALRQLERAILRQDPGLEQRPPRAARRPRPPRRSRPWRCSARRPAPQVLS